MVPTHLVKLKARERNVPLGSQGMGTGPWDKIVAKVSCGRPQVMDGNLQSVSSCFQSGRLAFLCLVRRGCHLVSVSGRHREWHYSISTPFAATTNDWVVPDSSVVSV